MTEEVNTMASFKISTDILSDNSVKVLNIAQRILEISQEVSSVNRNLYGCFPEDSILALRLHDYSTALESLSGRMRRVHLAMDQCAAAYANAEEQASADLVSVSVRTAQAAGPVYGAVGACESSQSEGRVRGPGGAPSGTHGSAQSAGRSRESGRAAAPAGSADTARTPSSYTQAEIGSTVLKKRSKKEVYIEAGIRTVAMFVFSQGDVNKTVENMREAHYARNEKNTDLPKTAAEAEALGWKRSDASLYHQFDDRSKEEIAEDMLRGFPEGNQKYVSRDGREVVYTHDGEHIVTDPENMGTYNYVEVESSEDIFGHLALDVLPYWLWGNSADDSTPFTARVLGPLFQ